MSDYQITKLFESFDDDEYTRYYSDDEDEYDYEGGAGKTAGESKKAGDDFQKIDIKANIPKSKKADQKENCCVNLFSKTFTYLFPAKAKVCYTHQGAWLRKMLHCAVLNHLCFFTFCLYFVGFKSTLSNMFLSFSAYSCALTLRKKMIFCYFCCLIIASCTEIYSDLFQKKDSIQKIGLLVNVCFYGINIFFVGKAFLSFRATGELRGDPDHPDFAKNILPEFLMPAIGQAGAMANKKMDKIIEKDKQEDMEAAAFNKKSKQKSQEPQQK